VRYELGFYILEDNILRSHLLENLRSYTLSLGSCLNIRDQVSCPYKTRGKIMTLDILIVRFLDSRGDTVECGEAGEAIGKGNPVLTDKSCKQPEPLVNCTFLIS
jgi:hypothetical protein